MAGPHVQHLTRLTDPLRPAVCQSCVWWQSRPFGREVHRERWINDVEDGFGAWGKVYVDGDRHVGMLQYGPAAAYPRARTMPAGPPSADAVLVTCAFLSDPSSPWALQSLFLACIGESRDRGAEAVETFGYRYNAGEPFAQRFLEHRTIFPRDFLSDFGFRTLREAGRVELMRLELRGLVLAEEPRGRLAEAVRRARELLAHPAPAAFAVSHTRGRGASPPR
jgi:hypothetical protein